MDETIVCQFLEGSYAALATCLISSHTSKVTSFIRNRKEREIQRQNRDTLRLKGVVEETGKKTESSV